MARAIDGNKLIEWFSPYLHTGEPIPADVVIEGIRSMPTLTPPNEPLTLEQLWESPHGKIKDSTLESICNRANEIASRPPEGEEDI